MEDDVAKALAYQVKRDLAERYFGFRRLIEEDTANYFKLIEEVSRKHEDKVMREFLRLYILLRDKDLIEEFLRITGLPEPYYYDEYITRSKNIRRRLFKALRPKGWTSKGRFKRLFLDTYERLRKAIEEYREAFQELQVEAEVINEEIKRFKEKFDLSEIMQFLKSLEGSSEELAILGHTSMEKSVSGLEKTLEFNRVPPPEKFLPNIPPLPPLKEVHSELVRLAKEAYRRHTEEAKEILEEASATPEDQEDH